VIVPAAGDLTSPPLPRWAREAARFTEDPVATARALRPTIERGSAESEQLGRLCDQTAQELCASGLLGLLLPRELGGIEADPATYIEVIEELSYADGSVGWVTMATNFSIAGAAAWYGDELIEAMFRRPGGIASAAHIAPNGVAERVDDGYRIRGQFHFGSGSQFAQWFMGAFVLHERGEPVRTPQGAPRIVLAYAPREHVFVDPSSWDVAGMRATASHDFLFLDQVVPDDYVLVPPGVRRRGGPALDLGVSMGHLSCSLGIAARMLDDLFAIARSKQRVGRRTLIDQPQFQRDFGTHRAALDAARALSRRVFEDWYRDAEANVTASLDTRARARLAACWGTKVATDVAQFAYLASGTIGLRNHADNRLQRCCRDMEATAVHRHIEDNVLIESTQVLLGVNDPDLYLI
jgi:alkylation response protein AidB-like acyl-CoA dehydrogenase